jgi:hypothetical protein
VEGPTGAVGAGAAQAELDVSNRTPQQGRDIRAAFIDLELFAATFPAPTVARESPLDSTGTLPSTVCEIECDCRAKAIEGATTPPLAPDKRVDEGETQRSQPLESQRAGREPWTTHVAQAAPS